MRKSAENSRERREVWRERTGRERGRREREGKVEISEEEEVWRERSGRERGRECQNEEIPSTFKLPRQEKEKQKSTLP